MVETGDVFAASIIYDLNSISTGRCQLAWRNGAYIGRFKVKKGCVEFMCLLVIGHTHAKMAKPVNRAWPF